MPSFHCFSVEHAITKMTKNEQSQLKLKSAATNGIEKFNIPKNTPVQYEVTLLNFEKVSDGRERRGKDWICCSRRRKNPGR